MSKIECKICGAQDHSIQRHLNAAHPEMTIEQYQITYPGAPIWSEAALEVIRKKNAAAAAAAAGTKMEMAGSAAATMDDAPAANVTKLIPKGTVLKKLLHEVFELGKVKAAMSARGDAIPFSVLSSHDQQDMVPPVSDNYVYDIDELKNVILALELGIPCLVWGHKGAGKSELLEQTSARTNRPMMRVTTPSTRKKATSPVSGRSRAGRPNSNSAHSRSPCSTAGSTARTNTTSVSRRFWRSTRRSLKISH